MEYIKVEDNQNNYRVVLSRPEKRNAFHPKMIQELTQAFRDIKNSKARYVHLCGEGESFCAGADLGWMKSMKNYTLEENLRDSQELFDMFEALSESPIPVTARVQGHVMGGANGLLSMCDVVAAENTTNFAFSEVRLGLVPAVISPFILSKMQKSYARGLMITGRLFSAEEALKGGLIEFCGTSTEVDDYLTEVHKSLLMAGPDSVKETINLLGALETCYDWKEVKNLTTRTIAQRRVSAEGQEGLSAFFDKRQPSWVQ